MLAIPPILAFISESGLFHFQGKLPDDVFKIIGEREVAVASAWDSQDWTDLRENVSAESGAWQTDRDFDKLINELVFAYTPQFEDGALDQLEDEANFDLSRCVSYMFNGKKGEALYPLLLTAYEAGGWPCGWAGSYPVGKLCVYYPMMPPNLDSLASAHSKRVAYQKDRARARLRNAV